MDTTSVANKLLSARTNIKFYHWATSNYARHKATCDLVAKLDALLDSIVEIYSATYGKPKAGTVGSIEYVVLTDTTAVQYLNSFADFLANDMPKYLSKSDTDLVNLRDELLGVVHQTLYLFTFK
jgi:hypothetical protein